MPAVRRPLSGDALLFAVTEAMVVLHQRYHHRSPLSAKTEMLGDDQLACVFGSMYDDVERTMIELQRGAAVKDTGSALGNSMRYEFIDVVQRLSGRTVTSLVSDSQVGPDLEVELFMLTPRNSPPQQLPVKGMTSMAPERSSTAVPQRDTPPTVAPELPPRGGPPRNRGGGAEAVAAVPGEPDLAVSLRLDAYAPRAARYYVGGVDRPSPDLRDAVSLLTGELVTRALRHRQFTAGEAVELLVWMPADMVRVELRGPRNLLAPIDAPAELRNGLRIGELADRWSIDVHERHTSAWFEIDRRELPALRAAARPV